MSGTNLGKMPILIVSLVIGIVMATTAIVPLVSDYSDAKTFENDGYFIVDVYNIESNDSLSISWDPSDPLIVVVDGEEIDLSNIPNRKPVSIIATSDTTILRFYNDSGTVTVQSYGGASLACSTNNGYSMNVVITGSTAVFTSTQFADSPSSVSLTGPVYYVNKTGDYVMKNADSVAYLNGDTEVYGIGTSVISGSGGKITKLTGTIDDGFTGSVVVPDTGYTSGTVTATYTEVNGYTDLYALEKCEWTVTDSSNVTTDLVYSYFIVPSEVSADTDNPAAYKALVKVVPVMAFVALIAAAAFMIYSKRD